MRNKRDYSHIREQELLRTFRNLLSEKKYKVTNRQFYEAISRSPCSRFFVSEDRAYRVLRKWREKDYSGIVSNQRLRMYQEIYQRVSVLRSTKTSLRLYDAICIVVRSPAPEFYLTPKSIKTILSKLRQRTYRK